MSREFGVFGDSLGIAFRIAFLEKEEAGTLGEEKAERPDCV